MTTREYDEAQTEALRQRDGWIFSILHSLARIQGEPGSLDNVADYLQDIIRDAQNALRINDDISINKLAPYSSRLLTCHACGRQYQEKHGVCICKG